MKKWSGTNINRQTINGKLKNYYIQFIVIRLLLGVIMFFSAAVYSRETSRIVDFINYIQEFFDKTDEIQKQTEEFLIADDEKLECDALEKMIRGNYSGVHLLPSVYDGQALVESVTENKPDIVIADINMPKVNGLDALEFLCASKGPMEVLIHTAYNDFDYLHRALKMGAADYLLKPVYEDDFLEVFYPVLSRVLNRKRSLTEETKKEKLAEDL